MEFPSSLKRNTTPPSPGLRVILMTSSLGAPAAASLGGVAIFNENPTVVISWGEGSTSDQVHHESPLHLKTLQPAPSGPSLDRFGGPKTELNP